MSTELAWLNGDIKHLRVLLRDANADESHYFAFPVELSRTKLDDVEPLRGHLLRLGEKQFMIYLSRLHHWGLVVWINPEIHTKDGESRPLCNFAWSAHTPTVHTFRGAHAPWEEYELEDAGKLNGFHRAEWWMARKFFRISIQHLKVDNYGPYPNCYLETKPGGIRKNQLFDVDSIVERTRYALLIGLGPNVDFVYKAMREEPGRITKRSLRRFLNLLEKLRGGSLNKAPLPT
jgi:hypothetical protein